MSVQRAVLPVLFRPEAPLPEIDTALRADLLAAARRHLGDASPPKATAAHWARTAVAFLLTASCWEGWLHGDATATLFLPFAHWLLAAHTCHDATHGSLSSSPEVNFWLQFTAHPIFFNVFVWLPQHVLSHHQYTQDAHLDVDMHHFAPAVLHTSTAEPKVASGWTFVIKGALSTLGTCLLQPARTLFDQKTPNFDVNITPVPSGLSKQALLLSTLPSLFVLLYPPIRALVDNSDFASSPLHLLFLTAWPWVGASMIWTSMTQVSHVQPGTQLEETESSSSSCWTARQIEASCDYSVDDPLERRIVGALTGGLNAQALHHALPTISQCHLTQELYDEFVQIAHSHGVRRTTSRHLGTAIAECLDFVFENNNQGRPPGGLTSPSTPPPSSSKVAQTVVSSSA